jgi:hypothetical protein
MRPRPATYVSLPNIGNTPPKSIRMSKMRAMARLVLYCHATECIQGFPGADRIPPTKRARNDQSRGRPTTPMNRKYRCAGWGSEATSSSVTGRGSPGPGGRSNRPLLRKGDEDSRTRRTFRSMNMNPDEPFLEQVALARCTSATSDRQCSRGRSPTTTFAGSAPRPCCSSRGRRPLRCAQSSRTGSWSDSEPRKRRGSRSWAPRKRRPPGPRRSAGPRLPSSVNCRANSPGRNEVAVERRRRRRSPGRGDGPTRLSSAGQHVLHDRFTLPGTIPLGTSPWCLDDQIR